MPYLIAPGRSLHIDGTVYPSGADAPTMSEAETALMLSEGVIVGPPAKAEKPKPVKVEKPKP